MFTVSSDFKRQSSSGVWVRSVSFLFTISALASFVARGETLLLYLSSHSPWLTVKEKSFLNAAAVSHRVHDLARLDPLIHADVRLSFLLSCVPCVLRGQTMISRGVSLFFCCHGWRISPTKLAAKANFVASRFRRRRLRERRTADYI